MSRKFGPRPADAPPGACAACGVEFKEGDFTALVSVGPGRNLDERERRDKGRPYNSVAVQVHWECGPYPNVD